MDTLLNKTIAEVVSDNISTASIFKKYNLDFCCGGGISIAKACQKHGINPTDLVKDLESNLHTSDVPNLNFKDWDILFLIDYIVNVHHKYVSDNLEVISEFAQKVAKVHGQHSPEVVEIAALYEKIAADLVPHMQKEEGILFPSIKAFIENKNTEFPFGSLEGPIAMMEFEHEEVGAYAKEIIKLSNNFAPPEWACNTYKALYFKLDEFINDLFQHIHLENNILFNKVRAL
ncbi:MAG: iron-sulfur cluster repair di-iron protein [Flavobacteriaceae bacterium]|nr:iron-sulfur cluster repair di-iron protein [Flavobacteriaceae bacterium]